MINRQRGFTLIEIVIAFTILAMTTVLATSLFAQSSTRASRINDHLAAMDVMESAIAILRGEIGNSELSRNYRGEQLGGYRWEADVLGLENPAAEGGKKYLNLYRVRIRVFDESDRPRLALTTIVHDR